MATRREKVLLEFEAVAKGQARVSRQVTALQKAQEKSLRTTQKQTDAINRQGRALARSESRWKQWGQAMGRARNQIAGFVAGFFAVRAGLRAVTDTLEAGINFEKWEVAFSRMLGGSGAAQRQLEFLTDFAAKTPFALPQIIEASKLLEALGLDTRQYLEVLGDVSSFLDRDLKDAVLALGNAARGEFESLKTFGVNIQEIALRAGVNINKAGRRTLADTRKIVSALVDFWRERFGGGMREIAKTTAGLLSNLGDAVFRFQLRISQSGIGDVLKDQLEAVLDLIERLDESGDLEVLARNISDVMVAVVRGTREGVEFLIQFRRELQLLVGAAGLVLLTRGLASLALRLSKAIALGRAHAAVIRAQYLQTEIQGVVATRTAARLGTLGAATNTVTAAQARSIASTKLWAATFAAAGRGLLALVGGPIGAAVLALGGLTFAVAETQRKLREMARERFDVIIEAELRLDVEETPEAIEKQIELIEKQKRDLEVALGGAAQARSLGIEVDADAVLRDLQRISDLRDEITNTDPSDLPPLPTFNEVASDTLTGRLKAVADTLGQVRRDAFAAGKDLSAFGIEGSEGVGKLEKKLEQLRAKLERSREEQQQRALPEDPFEAGRAAEAAAREAARLNNLALEFARERADEVRALADREVQLAEASGQSRLAALLRFRDEEAFANAASIEEIAEINRELEALIQNEQLRAEITERRAAKADEERRKRDLDTLRRAGVESPEHALDALGAQDRELEQEKAFLQAQEALLAESLLRRVGLHDVALDEMTASQRSTFNLMVGIAKRAMTLQAGFVQGFVKVSRNEFTNLFKHRTRVESALVNIVKASVREAAAAAIEAEGEESKVKAAKNAAEAIAAAARGQFDRAAGHALAATKFGLIAGGTAAAASALRVQPEPFDAEAAAGADSLQASTADRLSGNTLRISAADAPVTINLNSVINFNGGLQTFGPDAPRALAQEMAPALQELIDNRQLVLDR